MARFSKEAVGASRSDRFDWLRDYDRRAQAFAQATDWTEYSFFAFARFPRLRPAATDSWGIAGCEWYAREIASWEKRIAEHSEASLALKDLSGPQRPQLAALVSDAMDELEKFKNRRKNKEWASKPPIEGQSRNRKLQSKYRNACRPSRNCSNTPPSLTELSSSTLGEGQLRLFRRFVNQGFPRHCQLNRLLQYERSSQRSLTIRQQRPWFSSIGSSVLAAVSAGANPKFAWR